MVMKSKYKIAFLFLSVWLVLLAGCQRFSPIPQVEIGLATKAEKEITALMRRHTGRVESYSGFINTFSARALYLSREITEAAVEWEARARLMSSEEKEKLYREVAAEEGYQMNFLLAFYSPENRKALEDPESGWQVLVELPDGTLKRADCFGMGKEDGRIYIRFLRWDLSWANLYLVCFRTPPEVADPEGEGVKLIITGPEGSASMRVPTRSAAGAY